MNVKLDCLYYVGEKPCRFKRLCDDCPEYRSTGPRVLIIKLAAIGDVLRTTSLIGGLKKKYGNPHITWVTDAAAAGLLKGIGEIGRLLTFDLPAVLYLLPQSFDVLISLDKEPRAVGLSALINAREKFGFTCTPQGALTIFNPESEYALRLGLDDPLKFHGNKKSYPAIIYEMCAIPYEGQKYVIALDEKDRRWAESLLASRGIGARRPLIGLNTGAGPAFTHKAWNIEGFAGLAAALVKETGGTVLLLGGQREAERNRAIERESGGAATVLGGDQSLGEFAALLSLLDLAVTGDTMALHLAVGLSVPTVALFGPTAEAEVDLFGNGLKVVSAIDCAPCYRSRCEKNPHCMDAITVEEVLAACLKVLKTDQRKS